MFDHLLATKKFNGYAFFLEEDHYVAPDFLEVARQLVQLKQEKCQDCDFINLGMYTTLRTFDNKVSLACVECELSKVTRRTTVGLCSNCLFIFRFLEEFGMQARTIWGLG